MKSVALVLVALVGCTDSSVEITSPTSSEVVVGHGFVELKVTVLDSTVTSLVVDVDRTRAPFEVFPPSDLGSCTMCEFVARLPAYEITPGTRVIRVEARGPSGGLGSDDVTIEVDGSPDVRRIAPASILDLRGVATLTLAYEVFARDPVAISIAPDGIQGIGIAAAMCRGGCRLDHVWSIGSPGWHDVIVTAISDGAQARLRESLNFVEAVRVASISVSNVFDFGSLDLEVFLFEDATNKFLGCAGQDSGLGAADENLKTYQVDADLLSPSGALLELSSLPTTALRFEVWENDDPDECLTGPNTSGGDTLVGASPALTLAQWKTQHTPLSFGRVSTFEAVVGLRLAR